MCTARVRVDASVFFDQLYVAPSRLLLLDYDGTIAPFSVDRKRAFPYPSVPELLESISCTCRTRVVIVSGRSAHEIAPLLGLSWRPEIWGVHGLERLFPDDRCELGFISDDTMQQIKEAGALLDDVGLAELCELKRGCLAVHWRGLDADYVEEIRTQCYRLLAPLACQANLLLSEFDGGMELRARSASKGIAVQTLLSETEGLVSAAYLGDDATDEDAFDAINGRGLSVLVHPTRRATRAAMWLRPPGEFVQFLNDWIRACGGDV